MVWHNWLETWSAFFHIKERQQDVVPVKKQNWSVLVFVPDAIAQILLTRMQTRTIYQMMTMMMTYYSNLMATTLDSMAYLKNNDGNARSYYLRRAVDQYLFTYSIFSFASAVFKLIITTYILTQQQIYKKKSTSVGTNNQVESFLVILDSD
jgi:predicted DNA-binding protein